MCKSQSETVVIWFSVDKFAVLVTSKHVPSENGPEEHVPLALLCAAMEISWPCEPVSSTYILHKQRLNTDHNDI